LWYGYRPLRLGKETIAKYWRNDDIGCGIKSGTSRDEDSICFQEQVTKEITAWTKVGLGKPVVAHQQPENAHAKVIRDSRYQYLTLPKKGHIFQSFCN
jgi:hypothetical protein